MRLNLLFPLAFLSGIHGFLFFTPYLLAVLTVGYVLRTRRQAAHKALAFFARSADRREAFSTLALAAN